MTDELALQFHQVDRDALMKRICHSCANQLLVDGFFNGQSALPVETHLYK